ncbi:NAD-dependent epimerase/dehydratase family protein [Halosimplex amylolyticum]|uniref:NAD-dependent epimerase/dehydratase family protein n=1 Tax=Halosimplex amylolyticum TaxID=3396616 RepID=UPI003F54F1AE
MARDDGEEFDHDVETAVVTGATGAVGPWIVERLAESGVHVVGVDLERPDGERANAEFRAVDLTDQGEAWETIHEADPDAVVHAAAISGPLDDPGTRVFENSTMSTYNVLVAAGRVGADVVWTSSQAAYGMLFADDPWLPDYLPVDEHHERRPEDPYGTSKYCGEAVAGMVARQYDVPVTTIRPATVYAPEAYRARPQREGFDLESGSLSGNLWSYVDVRDVARMVEAALANADAGHETYLCVADENYLGQPTAEIIESVAGELPDRCDLEGEQAALSNAKAKEHLGWEPAYSWREADDSASPGIGWR